LQKYRLNFNKLRYDSKLFFRKIKTNSAKHHIQETIAVIEENYTFLQQHLKMEYCTMQGENSGSCKLFAFAEMQNLSEAATLSCFGAYYQEDVLGDPEERTIKTFATS
jgi:hypothetical protein